MKAIIVDDERPARSEIKRLLKIHPEIEVIGEANGIREALILTTKLQPDLLFLDIQMPDGTGFDLLEKLTAPIPHIIFTTAHDEYALRAFEVNALDYLLKPIEAKRLNLALKRMQISSSVVESEIATTRFTKTDRVFIRDDDKCLFIPIVEIQLLESEGNYTRIYTGTQKPLIYRSLNALEERMPMEIFFRANRSQIINLGHVETMENWFSGNLKVHLRGGNQVEISRRQATSFRERAAL
jgi:two-component system LytT family response regulator